MTEVLTPPITSAGISTNHIKGECVQNLFNRKLLSVQQEPEFRSTRSNTTSGP